MERLPKPIVIAQYDPRWAEQFSKLREFYLQLLGELVISVEHVGSTAVEGLCAKPVLDIDLVINDAQALEGIIPLLSGVGYEYLGEVAIPDRWVFRPAGNSVPSTSMGRIWPKHHLYACFQGSAALTNHLLLRDSLRGDPALRAGYAALKQRLALECGSMEAYVMGKTDFICEVLRGKGMSHEDLSAIAQQNKNVIPPVG